MKTKLSLLKRYGSNNINDRFVKEIQIGLIVPTLLVKDNYEFRARKFRIIPFLKEISWRLKLKDDINNVCN
jgi:hypothetical protein